MPGPSGAAEIHLAATQAVSHDLVPALTHLAEALETKADEFSTVVKAGRTHLMDATPVTLGQEFSGYAAQVRYGVERVESSLPRLAELVDGMVFESFSARWTDEGYAPWPADVLEFHAQIAEQLLQLELDLYALDYADTPGLTDFAMRRARQFGMQCVVSDRALSQV